MKFSLKQLFALVTYVAVGMGAWPALLWIVGLGPSRERLDPQTYSDAWRTARTGGAIMGTMLFLVIHFGTAARRANPGD